MSARHLSPREATNGADRDMPCSHSGKSKSSPLARACDSTRRCKAARERSIDAFHPISSTIATADADDDNRIVLARSRTVVAGPFCLDIGRTAAAQNNDKMS